MQEDQGIRAAEQADGAIPGTDGVLRPEGLYYKAAGESVAGESAGKPADIWRRVPPTVLHEAALKQESYVFYEWEFDERELLCRAGWCSILYFEAYAKVEGVERSFCEPGNMMLIRDRECRIMSEGRGTFWMVNFTRDFFDINMSNMIADCPFYYDFLNSRDGKPEMLYYTTKNEGERWLASELLKAQLRSDDRYTVKNVKLSLALFLTIFHRYHFRDQNISASTMMPEYKEGQILRYLSENYPVATLAGTAAAFNYHPNYFSVLFQKLFFCEFSTKLQQIRLERARYLLSTTDLTVEQVRAAVGFQEKSYFYRIFRKKYGTTPAAFRREVQKKIPQG